MLFDPIRHEPLMASEWSDSRAHKALRAIVEDLQDSLRADNGWPVHPLDRAEEPLTGLKTLYMGAAGTLWSLWYLERQGAVKLHIEPDEQITRTYESYLADPDTGEVVPSCFLGEVGILLVLWRLTDSSKAADRLFASIRENIPNPANEALWAAPGTMVGAWHMFQWTGERRWHDLFLENVEQLWLTWKPSENGNCHLWTQDMHGRIAQFLGAGHGFAGNVYPLLHGSSVLPPERRTQLHERCVETLRVTAAIEGDEANWPACFCAPQPGQKPMLMQWCHGAPGMVTGLADFPTQESPEMDTLLDQGRQCGVEGRSVGKGLWPLSWHRRQWLCVARSSSPNRRSALAHACAILRHARHPAAAENAATMRSRALHVVDGRRWTCRLHLALPDGRLRHARSRYSGLRIAAEGEAPPDMRTAPLALYCREYFLRRDHVLDLLTQEPAYRRIHRGFQQLRRIHFAESLVALDGRAVAGLCEQPVERVLERTDGQLFLPALPTPRNFARAVTLSDAVYVVGVWR